MLEKTKIAVLDDEAAKLNGARKLGEFHVRYFRLPLIHSTRRLDLGQTDSYRHKKLAQKIFRRWMTCTDIIKGRMVCPNSC